MKDLAKLASIDKKDPGQRVTDIRKNLDKVIHQEIINPFGSDSILPEDVAKNGIIGVILILFLITYFNFISSSPCPYLFRHNLYSCL